MNHLKQIAAKLPEYEIDAMLLSSAPGEFYGVGFRKGSDLVDAFNEFWAAAEADGTALETATTYGLEDAVILD